MQPFVIMIKRMHAMGYKGITKKLTKAVSDMLTDGMIEIIAGDGSTNKLKVKYHNSITEKIL